MGWRAQLGVLMPDFLAKHGAPGRILQSRCVGDRTRFELATSGPNSIVQSLAMAWQWEVYLTHKKDGSTADPGQPPIKLSNQKGQIPHQLYHATDLPGALGAIVTGHLVASNDSRPRAVYFSARLDKITSYDKGAIFTAKIYGLYPGKKQADSFYDSVVPMGIVLHNNRSAGDWMCDAFSHTLESVTINTELLKSFLGEWVAAGSHVLPLPVPPMVTTPSHRLIAKLELMLNHTILAQLTAAHARLVSRRNAYVEEERRTSFEDVATSRNVPFPPPQKPPRRPRSPDPPSAPGLGPPARRARVGDRGDSDPDLAKF